MLFLNVFPLQTNEIVESIICKIIRYTFIFYKPLYTFLRPHAINAVCLFLRRTGRSVSLQKTPSYVCFCLSCFCSNTTKSDSASVSIQATPIKLHSIRKVSVSDMWRWLTNGITSCSRAIKFISPLW